MPGEQASGHWIYSFLRRDPETGQKFLVVINLNPTRQFDDVRLALPSDALKFLVFKESSTLRLSGKLGSSAEIKSAAAELSVGSIPPLTACFFEITEL